MRRQASPDWLDKTGFGVIGRFTLNDGEDVTAKIVDYNEDSNELLVEPITTVETHGNDKQTTRAIAVDRVLAFAPELRSSHAWPHSDPGRTGRFSFARFTMLASLFLGSTFGSLVLFITLMNGEPYRLQELSAVSYTFAVVWLTFAAHRNAPRFLFSCPAVKSRLPTLLSRHIGFLVVLVLLQTAALSVRLRLPTWWISRDSKGGSPFQLLLLFLCCGLGLAEVYTGRSILKRAHSDPTDS